MFSHGILQWGGNEVIFMDRYNPYEIERDSDGSWVGHEYNYRSSSSSSSGSGRNLVVHNSRCTPRLAPIRFHPASFYGRTESYPEKRIMGFHHVSPHRMKNERQSTGARRHTNFKHRYSGNSKSSDRHFKSHSHIHMPSPSPSPLGFSDQNLPDKRKDFNNYKHNERFHSNHQSSASSSQFVPQPLVPRIYLQQSESKTNPPSNTTENKDPIASNTDWSTRNFFNKDNLTYFKEQDMDDLSLCPTENPPPTFTLEKYQPNVNKRETRPSCSAVFIATTSFSILVLLLITAFILYTEMILKHKEYVPESM